MTKYISKTSVGICAGIFGLGVLQGWSMYGHRSAVIDKHVVGSNAWGVHILLALILIALIGLSVFYHRKAARTPYIIWLSPFTKTALERVKNTILLKRGVTAGNVIRGFIVAFLVITSLFFFFRAGMQVIGSADPNWDINAWGGPTRLGASLAHWMDSFYCFYIEAGIAALLVVKGKPRSNKKSKKRSR